MPEEKAVASFSETDIKDKDRREDYQFVVKRIKELQEARQNHYGVNLDQLWSDADKDYIPHRLNATGTKVIATDEERGWRGSVVTLGSDNWQSDISQANPYIKIQTALSILVDQNPSGSFTPGKKKYQATTLLIEQLYKRSWEIARSKGQLKLFIFNLAKYGWAIGRTYPLKLEDKNGNVEYNDIFRENLDPRNAWIDDMAKPNNPFSLRDWCWRKIYTDAQLEAEFGDSKFYDKAKAVSGLITETVTDGKTVKELKRDGLHEIYFYENLDKDLFEVHANGVPVLQEELPIADSTGRKKLTLWQAYWNLRHSESPYGIGIYESMRYDQAMLDRIRNMTLDQLTLSIYKMFFYQGTQNLQNTGEIKVTPGAGKQILDPKNMNFLEVPGPGKEAWDGYAQIRRDVDEVSGITDPLLGQVTGKTAFEIAQAKESALKRLKNPLDNILEALNEEAYLTVAVAQLIYSIPEVHAIADERLINDYLKEIDNDTDLFERSDMKDEEGNPVLDEYGEPKTEFKAKIYREFPLGMDSDEKGNLTETKDTRFFRIKPRFLDWEGVISIKSQSLLSPSKQVDKALDMELYAQLTNLLSLLSQERMIAVQSGQPSGIDDLPHGKETKELIKLYEKDPRDILPDEWLKPAQPPTPSIPQEQSLIVPQGGGAAQSLPSAQPMGQENGQIPQEPQGIVGKIMSKISQPFRKV